MTAGEARRATWAFLLQKVEEDPDFFLQLHARVNPQTTLEQRRMQNAQESVVRELRRKTGR